MKPAVIRFVGYEIYRRRKACGFDCGALIYRGHEARGYRVLLG